VIRGVLVLDATELPGPRFDVDVIEVAFGGVMLAATDEPVTVPLLIEAAHAPGDNATGARVRIHVSQGEQA
jgi:hypothetical protein